MKQVWFVKWRSGKSRTPHFTTRHTLAEALELVAYHRSTGFGATIDCVKVRRA